MSKVARPLAAALAGAAVMASAALAPAASSAGPVAPAGKAPKGYVVVQSAILTDAAGGQTRGSMACPRGTVPFGGGVLISSFALDQNVASSFPADRGWVADVANAGGVDGTFRIFAVCGQAPRRYAVQVSRSIAAPTGGRVSGSMGCPASTSILGGGSRSTGGDLATRVNSTFPTGNAWRADVSNGSASPAAFQIYAICGQARGSYSVVAGAAVTNPPGTQSEATVTCPRGTVPLSGGGASRSTSPAVSLNTTEPSGRGWAVLANNASSETATVTAFAVCT